MQIKEIDPDDNVFISLFEDYCLNSKPLPKTHEGSLSRRLAFIGDYRKELCSKEGEHLVIEDINGTPLLFSFFSLSKDKDFVFLEFILPNTRLVSTSNIIKYQTAFCESFIYVYKKTGLDLIKSDISRVCRKRALIKTLQRFVGAFTLIKNKKNEVTSVEVKKENVIKFYEKLQIKNNRNKLDDKTP